MTEVWVVIFVLGVLVVFGWAVFYSRKRARAKGERLAQLGFTYVKEPPEALRERVASLHERGGSPFVFLKNVYQREEPDGQLVIFDALESGDEETSTIGEEIIGYISPGLELPRFALLVRPPAGGKFGEQIMQAVDRMIGVAVSRTGMVYLGVDDEPELEEKFYLFGDSEIEVRQILDVDRLWQLCRLYEAYNIQASGDFFTLQLSKFVPSQSRRLDYSKLADDARRVYQVLTW